MATAQVFAGIPATNFTLYHRMRFAVGDPTAVIEIKNGQGEAARTLIIRDIEMGRARQHARADAVACPADFAPESGLSGDRETATAQATAECLRRAGVTEVTADRTLPLIFAHEMERAGIRVECNPELGVSERRAKDEAEVEALRRAQAVTEKAMAMACGMVARAQAGADGGLVHEGAPLTSERVRAAIDHFLLDRSFINPACIVAGGAQGGDCHERGSGPLRTGESVIIDIFPRDRATLYNGDCTRTVVHGDVPDALAKMHQTVLEAKCAALAVVRAGTTGAAVHEATTAVITAQGYQMGLPPEDAPPTAIHMSHGTGHGIGLDVHEPPLLDRGGPELVVGDALTVEPGLYSIAHGGVRVEDMVIVTADGCRNLNTLPEGLDWR